MFSRIIGLTKGKVSSKVADIRKAHALGLCNKLNVVKSEDKWEVLEGRSKHSVQEINVECSCQLVFVDCRVCIHRYVCTF